MSLSTSIHELKSLILSYHPVIVIETVEEERALTILGAVSEQLNMKLFEWTITRGLSQVGKVSSYHRTKEPQALLAHLEELTIGAVYVLKDFAQHLDDHKTARKCREVCQAFSRTRSTLVLTGGSIELPGDIEHLTVRYDFKLPDLDEIRQVVRSTVSSLGRAADIELQLKAADYEGLLHALRGLTLNQARQVVAYSVFEDNKLSAEDIQNAINRKVQLIREGGLLEFYPAADNRYQLGGFPRLKAWLERSRIGFSEQAAQYNLSPPRGILIVGIQGCGKSLAAKCIAREWNLPLLKLDAGRLFDKYIGESEKNFRTAIDMAETMAPVVLWIDEIEKGLSTGGGSESDGGLSRRLFGAFLTWLQEKRKEVFVVATANDLSILPPELLRKGRFDEIFFVDLPTTEERQAIFKIHLGLKNLDPADFDVARLAAAAEGFSGSEIEQAVIASLYRALHAQEPLTDATLLEEMQQTVPLSITRKEDIDRLRETARGRFVSVR